MDNEYEIFNAKMGEEIMRLRIKANLSINDLSRKSNVSVWKIKKIEKVGFNSVLDLFKLALALNTRADIIARNVENQLKRNRYSY